MSLSVFHRVSDGPLKRWIEKHFFYADKDWCLIWPFARKGGGYAEFSSQHLLVHRLMCEFRNGPPPSPTHQAAHSCERGHDGCVNPWHLDWKTPTENQLDRFRQDASAKPREKLTAEQVFAIRALKGVEPSDITAVKFRVCESNVRLIQAGKTWKNLSKVRRIFNREEISRIRAKPYATSAKDLALEFGVTKSIIEKIRSGETYKYYQNADPHLLLSPADRGQSE